jgi:hypothetical protein
MQNDNPKIKNSDNCSIRAKKVENRSFLEEYCLKKQSQNDRGINDVKSV